MVMSSVVLAPSLSPTCQPLTFNIGFSALPGSNTQTITLPYTGEYTVLSSVTNGSPPSNVVLLLNGQSLTTISPAGGQYTFNASQGDQLTITVTWGWFYLGGTTVVSVCLVQPFSPSPPPLVKRLFSGTILYLIIILAIIGVIAAVMVLRKKGQGS